MSELKNPSDIAREALRCLALRPLAPTPANYQACYNEIAGIPDFHPFPEGPLRTLLAALPTGNGEQEEQLDRLSSAIAKRSWQDFRDALTAYVQLGNGASSPQAERLAVLPQEFAGPLATFVESILPALGDDNSRAVGMGSELVLMLRQPLVEVLADEGVLAALSHHARYAAEEQVENVPLDDELCEWLRLFTNEHFKPDTGRKVRAMSFLSPEERERHAKRFRGSGKVDD